MAVTDWHDLSGMELRARLERRGCPPGVAKELSDHRDRPPAPELIEEWLKP